MVVAKTGLKSGLKITLEGTAEEVAAATKLIGENQNLLDTFRAEEYSEKITPISNRGTILGYISELNKEGFFSQKRKIGEIKEALDAKGQIYPTTTLSGSLLKAVKNKIIRRLKEKGTWIYVKK